MNKTAAELFRELNHHRNKDRKFTTTIERAIAEQYRNGGSFEAEGNVLRTRPSTSSISNHSAAMSRAACRRRVLTI